MTFTYTQLSRLRALLESLGEETRLQVWKSLPHELRIAYNYSGWTKADPPVLFSIFS